MLVICRLIGMNYPAIIEAIELIRYRPEVPPDKRSTPILLPKDFHLLDTPLEPKSISLTVRIETGQYGSLGPEQFA